MGLHGIRDQGEGRAENLFPTGNLLKTIIFEALSWSSGRAPRVAAANI